MRFSMSLGHEISQLLLGMRSSNKHKIMPKWGIFNVSELLNEHGHPSFVISKLKFSYEICSGQSLNENLLSLYFRGITLRQGYKVSLPT